MARRVVAAIEDLMFRSKVSGTAGQLGVETDFPRSPDELLQLVRSSPPDLLILDLNSARFDPLDLLRTLKSEADTRSILTIGFLSHIQKDLAVSARESGCDRVMARSAFTQDLPQILAGDEAPGKERR